jgi:hypothetical protein
VAASAAHTSSATGPTRVAADRKDLPQQRPAQARLPRPRRTPRARIRIGAHHTRRDRPSAEPAGDSSRARTDDWKEADPPTRSRPLSSPIAVVRAGAGRARSQFVHLESLRIDLRDARSRGNPLVPRARHRPITAVPVVTKACVSAHSPGLVVKRLRLPAVGRRAAMPDGVRAAMSGASDDLAGQRARTASAARPRG